MKKLTLVTVIALVTALFPVPVMAADISSANGSEPIFCIPKQS